ncbi:MAG: CDP-diacylglycerol--serine O-phosphatidyltransferase [Betaproteobacteria bacterium]|jgi:CDP-diacylglycerol--serine O-phosphatidyltransferase|nr:CDP-diacylglycerol--serine O-phosphatidyltransferase [Betaproteobacteria bacterium]
MEPREHKVFIKSRFARRGIYWLPNMFTIMALFSGFYAIVQAMGSRYEQAAIAIFVAMVLDGMDGRIARLTRTQSAFGAELDSLSDMVSFGVAPALVVYHWALSEFEIQKSVTMLGPWLTARLGWIAAFVYCACAALRLARFNTNIEVVDKRFFQGLPSPAAASLIAGLVWAMEQYHINREDVRWVAWALTMFAGMSMVSNFKFYSGKDINLRKSVPFSVVVGIAMGLVFVIVFASTLPEMLFLLFTGYALSGYVLWVIDACKRKSPRSPAPP